MATLAEVADEINNTDFTGHVRATGRSLWLAYADTMIFLRGDTRYLWIGSRGITVGLDGSHDTTEFDLLLLSSLDHFDFSNVGNYTHAEIDAHINDKNNPHEVTATQAGAVDKVADDVKTGNLTLDGSAAPADLILKGDPEPLGAPTKGSGIAFANTADEVLGGAAIFQPDPTNNPLFTALGFGSLSDVVPVHLISAGLVLDSEIVAVGVEGAEVGSKLVCAGFTLDGKPILGWEDPPPPSYDAFCEDPTDELIHSGTGTGLWEILCSITTTQEIAAGQTYYLYWSILADNRSSRTGTMQIAVTVDGAAPTGPEQTVPISGGFYETVSGSDTGIAPVVFPVGTTLDLWVRGSGDHVQFDLWTAGTDQPSRLDLQVR